MLWTIQPFDYKVNGHQVSLQIMADSAFKIMADLNKLLNSEYATYAGLIYTKTVTQALANQL